MAPKPLFVSHLILLAALAFSGLSVVACNSESNGNTRSARPTKSETATVAKVVDGDTIKVNIDGVQKSVRLIGIDTPETHKPGVKVECGGKEASAYMAELAPVGEAVKLTPDPTQDAVDRYGRLLAYVEVKGQSLQLDQIYAGNAKVYVYRKPFQRVDIFRRAQQVAKDAQRGVWSKCGGDFHDQQPGD